MNTVPVKAYNGLSIDDLRQQLLVETDVTNINDITRQLIAHLQKKEIIRLSELSEIQDKLQKQMDTRITEKANCFSNADLLAYYKTIQDSLTKMDPTSEIQAAPIKMGDKTTININLDNPDLSREEKMQAVNAVKALISRVQQEQIDKNIIDGDYKEIND